jgi:cysteine desulfurase/selenocysteine lyase
VDALVAALRKIRAERVRSRTRRCAAGDECSSPKASQPTPDAAADELADVFEMLGDRDARNEYVLDLGGKLPHQFDALKRLTARVPGA